VDVQVGGSSGIFGAGTDSVPAVTLRRRLLSVFAAYVLVVSAGAALVARIVVLRDEAGVDDLRSDLTLIVAGMVLATIAVTITAVVLVRRSVTQPLDRIGRAVRDVRTGARHTSIPTTGPLELARLGADIERLRRQLNSEVLDAVKAREAVEQSASVLLSLRSQLEPDLEALPGEWTATGQVEPAEGVVAGDCYDLVRMSASQLGLVVVDISGHGAVPGVLALRCRELLRAALRNGLDPGESLHWAHDQLDDLGDETFLSAFVAVADLATGGLRYANAGHPPPILCASDVVVELAPSGPIVGPLDGRWHTAYTRLAAGDTLAVYTDGFIEVRRDDGEEFGVERLIEIVGAAASDEADAVVKRAIDEVTGFAPGRLRDDATIVLLCRGPRVTRPAVRLQR
jgi:sigma-B regulation protein RsbU (phosphoserine phosphatase)